MFEKYDELLHEITELLLEGSLDLNNWTEIIINIERPSSDSIGVQAEYLDSNGEIVHISGRKILNNKFELFHELYQAMTAQTDKHKWNRAKVTLDKDGKLNIKFDWDQEPVEELEELSNEYDPRWDDSLTQEEKDQKYKEMVESGELPDLSNIDVSHEE